MLDEAALAEALANKTIAGAGLDVYEFEPKVTEVLIPMSNIVLAPHLGNATIETRDAMAEIAAKNIIDMLSGGPGINVVNLK